MTKLAIKKFGSKAQRIEKHYPNAKVLVFTGDTWQLCGATAVAINDRLSYVLVKQAKDYYILAEKRLGEFISRMTSTQN